MKREKYFLYFVLDEFIEKTQVIPEICTYAYPSLYHIATYFSPGFSREEEWTNFTKELELSESKETNPCESNKIVKAIDFLKKKEYIPESIAAELKNVFQSLLDLNAFKK